MGEVNVGRLQEILVMKTRRDGLNFSVVYPKGAIVEVSTEDDYPHEFTEEEYDKAIKALKDHTYYIDIDGEEYPVNKKVYKYIRRLERKNKKLKKKKK